MIRSLWKKFVAPIDGPLMAIIALLLGVGMISMASASPVRVSTFATHIAIALVAMRVAAELPPQQLMRFALPLYLVGVLLLIGVALFGDITKGARRWLDLGFIRIQPSALLKIALPLMLAWYFHKYESTLRFREHMIAALILLVPVALILRQPDLGTAILIFASGFFVIFLAGLPWKVLIGMGAAAVAAAPFAWHMLHEYQRQRILTLFDPEQDPLGRGFHTIQSSIAIGSGGWFGKGWGEGSQNQLDFLPEQHTDFIFAVWSEEFGLVGNIFLLTLYAMLIARGLQIALNAPTTFARLLAGAITLICFSYVFVNVGMVIGILPVVGVPLPFVSFGGTTMVTLMLGIGILMSIQNNRMIVLK